MADKYHVAVVHYSKFDRN